MHVIKYLIFNQNIPPFKKGVGAFLAQKLRSGKIREARGSLAQLECYFKFC